LINFRTKVFRIRKLSFWKIPVPAFGFGSLPDQCSGEPGKIDLEMAKKSWFLVDFWTLIIRIREVTLERIQDRGPEWSLPMHENKSNVSFKVSLKI
jgi:hypothetical protein